MTSSRVIIMKFYITTSLVYTNAAPHIGFALELIQADVLARFHKINGEDVFYLTGTDEHGAKIAGRAKELGKTPEDLTDELTQEYKNLTQVLDISNNDFIRTTDQKRHWPGVFKVWQKLKENDDLYKKNYKGLYCVGHEAFMKKSDLKDGVCPDHQIAPQVIEEENYFFRLTRYKDAARKAIENGDFVILPESKKNETLNLLKDAEDVSFSRPRKDIAWGIPVPDDDSQTMYVWADALTNYISAIGYGRDEANFSKWWPAEMHLVGKDILRFHTIIWPAMLLAIGLPLPKAVYSHGHITVDGQKMSKTIGNVVDPFAVTKDYGVDAVRYFLLREIPSSEDGDFSQKKLEERYNGDLANNLGNLVSRVLKIIETKFEGELNREAKFLDKKIVDRINESEKQVAQHIGLFKLHEAISELLGLFSFANEYVNQRAPWADTNPEHLSETLINLGEILVRANFLLWPFLPDTSEKITVLFGHKEVKKDWDKIIVTETKQLFPRLK